MDREGWDRGLGDSPDGEMVLSFGGFDAEGCDEARSEQKGEGIEELVNLGREMSVKVR